MSEKKMLESFLKNTPDSIKVYDEGRKMNIILDKTEEGDRYITRRNMGTPSRRVRHYWSFTKAFYSQIS